VRWRDDELTVYVDPWGTGDDAAPADLILITHAHDDHLQPDEIERLRGAHEDRCAAGCREHADVFERE
jgi:L-ascorbate metabolism protein UlaG (beta-lactamase superfamily)